MTKLAVWLVVGLITLSVLVSAGPAFVALVRGVVPAVLAVGGVVIIARLVWHYTNRY